MRKYSPGFLYTLSQKLSGIYTGGSTNWWVNRVSKFYGMGDSRLVKRIRAGEVDEENIISAGAFLEALQHRVPYYQRLYSIEDGLNTFVNGPKSFSITFECFSSISNSLDGHVKLPEIGEESRGYHSVAVHGYSQPERYFLFNNSWGRHWGDNGRGYLPFEYLEQGLTNEMWAMGSESKRIAGTRQVFRALNKENQEFRVEENYYEPLRISNYVIITWDIYLQEKLIGTIHASPIDEHTIEIEEFYILPEFQNKGMGNFALDVLENWVRNNNMTKIIGWIPAQDLVDGRDLNVKAFFGKRKYALFEEDSRFKDAVYKFEKEIL